METVLTGHWLGNADAIEIRDEASLTLVRDAVRALEAPSEIIDRAVLVASELGRNQLRHARRGQIACRVLDRGAFRGIEIVAADAGKGLPSLDALFDAAPRSRGSLGVGIGAVRRMSSELDVDVRREEGTCFTARLFDRAAPRRREVGVFGRPFAGEIASGDHALFVRDADALAVAVCDGLGHGPSARTAADLAIEAFAANAAATPVAVLEHAHRRGAAARGAVMAMVRVHEPAGDIELASVGNVEVIATAPRNMRRFGGSSAVLGGRPGPLKIRGESSVLASDEVLVLVTDGITSKLSIEADFQLLHAHPAIIAERVLERFARANDDALVLVAR